MGVNVVVAREKRVACCRVDLSGRVQCENNEVGCCRHPPSQTGGGGRVSVHIGSFAAAVRGVEGAGGGGEVSFQVRCTDR